MNKTKVFGFLFGCIVAVLVGWFIWYFVVSIQEADANAKAGIIGVLGVFVVTILTHFFIRKREINARHFLEKREAYGKIMEIIFNIIASTKSGKSGVDKELTNKMMMFKKELIIWGGHEVIRSWNDFEIESEKPNRDPNIILAAMEHVLRAIRKDLGHNDRQLKFGSLFGLLILAKDKNILLKDDK